MGKLFKATYWDGTAVDITSDGATLTMSDNSNYGGERGTAVAADATHITLESGADGTTTSYYDNMSVLIVDGLNDGSIGLVTAGGYAPGTQILTVASWSAGTPDNTSVYEISEQGHHKEDFSTLRKVNITLPGDTEYLLSSIGDGDATTVTPDGTTIPIDDTYAYSTGDGIFTVKLSVVPTYKGSGATSTVAYRVGHTVYYGSSYYICIRNAPIGTLVSDTFYWTAITFAALSDKYTDERKFYIDHDLREGRVTAAYKARNLANYPSDMPGILKSRSFQTWQMLDLIIETLGELVDKQAWDEIEHDINFGKNLIAYNE